MAKGLNVDAAPFYPGQTGYSVWGSDAESAHYTCQAHCQGSWQMMWQGNQEQSIPALWQMPWQGNPEQWSQGWVRQPKQCSGMHPAEKGFDVDSCSTACSDASSSRHRPTSLSPASASREAATFKKAAEKARQIPRPPPTTPPTHDARRRARGSLAVIGRQGVAIDDLTSVPMDLYVRLLSAATRARAHGHHCRVRDAGRQKLVLADAVNCYASGHGATRQLQTEIAK